MGPPQALPTSRNKRRRDEGPTSGTGKPSGSKNEGLYHCDYCHKDLSSSLRIKCAVCKDFDLCLECFSVGVVLNVAGHSSNHAYKVVQSLGFPLYHPAWRADEELLLVEGIEIYGMGNWAKVAEHVGKTVDECRAHYLSTYIHHDGAPLPKRDESMAGVDIKKLVDEYRRTGREPVASLRALGASAGPTPKRSKSSAAAASTAAAAAGGGGGGSGVLPALGLGLDAAAEVKVEDGGVAAEVKQEESEVAEAEVKLEQQQERQPHQDGQMAAAAAGGGAGKKRHTDGAPPSSQQLEQQQEQQGAAPPAEAHRTQGTFALRPAAPAATSSFVVAVTPGGTGAAADGTAKIPAATEAQQTGYNIKRNEFEPEWDAEAETIIGELADFSPDDPPDEAAQKDRLIEIYNRRLDERERRRQFILDRGLLNIRKQQALDKRRSAAERELHGGLRVLARHLPQDQFETLAEGIAVEQRLRARIAELQEYRAMGLRTFEQVDEVEAAQEARKKREAQQAQQLQAIRNRINKVAVDEGALQEALVESIGAAHAAAALGQQHSTLAEGRGHSGLSAWRGKRGVLLDITSLPDAEPLSQRERYLCASERYLPAQYLAVKAAALKLQEQRGRVARADIQRLPFQVDPQRIGRLYDFFLQQGWVTAGAGSGSKPHSQQQQQQHWAAG